MDSVVIWKISGCCWFTVHWVKCIKSEILGSLLDFFINITYLFSDVWLYFRRNCPWLCRVFQCCSREEQSQCRVMGIPQYCIHLTQIHEDLDWGYSFNAALPCLISSCHPKEVLPLRKSLSCQNLIFSCKGLFSLGSMNWCSWLGMLLFLNVRGEGRSLQWGTEELRTSVYLLDSYFALHQSKSSGKIHPEIKYQLFHLSKRECWRECKGLFLQKEGSIASEWMVLTAPLLARIHTHTHAQTFYFNSWK